ncbi:MAG: uncharacterized protein A8A55_1817 [Amphiamblys sp. WSBS2006]|nr:MAG: uncharacterized protein A8A55_1817 [Amphiamblys sp. WSBS2006]
MIRLSHTNEPVFQAAPKTHSARTVFIKTEQDGDVGDGTNHPINIPLGDGIDGHGYTFFFRRSKTKPHESLPNSCATGDDKTHRVKGRFTNILDVCATGNKKKDRLLV